MCIEVAEHIEENKADLIVEKVSEATLKTLIWTAATPGQGGIGHINCQPKEYWLEKFTKIGLVRNTEKEQQLIEHMKTGSVMGWFVKNLMIFERK
jgi:hypothetical protein